MDPLDLTPSIPPLMTFNEGPPNFDYTAFWKDDEIEYLAEDSSSNSNLALTAHSSSSTSPPTATVSKKGSHDKQRHERRGHTKSRRGCYNCKRRRIKCQETHPACGHCIKMGLQCEYPAVAQIVHQYEYLMHAVLGLAATELMVQDRSLVSFAMAHRLKAIKSIKKTLANVPKADNFEEGNALIATCFALTFQSVMLDDGMTEFMTFCRGIVIVAIQMYYKGAKIMFTNFLGDDQMALLKPLIEVVPPINSEWASMALAGIRALRPLCNHAVEIEYQKLLLEIAEALPTPLVAYQNLCKHYGWWMQIRHEDFSHLVNMNNMVCVLLASHWVALKQIMATITEKEYEARPKGPWKEEDGVDLGMIRWLKYLNQQVGPEHQKYNEWPVWVETQLDADLTFFGKTKH
ncbi:hypothetical protein JX265_005069 [Neoarthrinium moseri]|uniref:Zn(2)-C6 fungal-type domain-containing protein n=1 Tax=Neoarthrinium moseri TaxID=1658444 RepID=A0A9Q0AQE2_9PEZI|nr:hypothetical protein JX265_005069 [Neoarthrinium moseri]